MKIVYLSECSEMGGAEHSLIRLMEGMKKKRCDVYLVAPDGELAELATSCGVKHYKFDFGRLNTVNPYKLLLNLCKAYKKIRQISKENSIDIIHSNTFRTRVYLALLSWVLPQKTVAHVRDYNQSKLNPFLLKRIDRTIAISSFIDKSLGREAGLTIYNGVEDLRNTNSQLQLRSCYGLSKKTKIIAIVGRIEEWKNQHVFIEAAEKILRISDDYIFLIVGGAIKSEHEKYLEQLKAMGKHSSNKIIFIGHTSSPFEFIKEVDLLVCPSNNEPFGRVVIEAMSIGTHIIGSDNGGVSEILSHTKDYLTFKVNCADALFDKIINYKFDKKITEHNYKAYADNFSLESNIQQTKKLYDEIS